MIRRSRSWRQVKARGSKDACGHTFATIARPVMHPLRQSGLLTRRIAEQSIHMSISPTFTARCRPMHMPASTGRMTAVAFGRQAAGLMSGASSLTCMRHIHPRLQPPPAVCAKELPKCSLSSGCSCAFAVQMSGHHQCHREPAERSAKENPQCDALANRRHGRTLGSVGLATYRKTLP